MALPLVTQLMREMGRDNPAVRMLAPVSRRLGMGIQTAALGVERIGNAIAGKATQIIAPLKTKAASTIAPLRARLTSGIRLAKYKAWETVAPESFGKFNQRLGEAHSLMTSNFYDNCQREYYMGDPTKAAQWAGRMQKLAPEMSDGWSAMSEVCLRTGDRKGALTNIETAIDKSKTEVLPVSAYKHEKLNRNYHDALLMNGYAQEAAEVKSRLAPDKNNSAIFSNAVLEMMGRKPNPYLNSFVETPPLDSPDMGM